MNESTKSNAVRHRLFLFGCRKDDDTLDQILPPDVFDGIGVSDDASGSSTTGHDDALRCAKRRDPKQYRDDKLLSRQLDRILFEVDPLLADHSALDRFVLAESGRNQIP